MYRRYRDHRQWHWFVNCPYWPSDHFDVSAEKPLAGELCEHCQRMERQHQGEEMFERRSDDPEQHPG